MQPLILGILNVTRDSFSDGGRYMRTEDAIAHGLRLWSEAAHAIDIGAESTHPDAEDVSAQEEIHRLTPVVAALRDAGVRISIDTCKPAVMLAMLKLGVAYVNDVTGFADAQAVRAVRSSDARLIVMHARRGRAETAADVSSGRAVRQMDDPAPGALLTEIEDFFRKRTARLIAEGIDASRIILDPGMGFFLSAAPGASLVVLRHLRRLTQLGYPLLVSTSRKSFVGAILAKVRAAGPHHGSTPEYGRGPGAAGAPTARPEDISPALPAPVHDRGAGVLATEVWAALHGAAYIRTHEVAPLRDALGLIESISRAGDRPPEG